MAPWGGMVWDWGTCLAIQDQRLTGFMLFRRTEAAGPGAALLAQPPPSSQCSAGRCLPVFMVQAANPPQCPLVGTSIPQHVHHPTSKLPCTSEPSSWLPVPWCSGSPPAQTSAHPFPRVPAALLAKVAKAKLRGILKLFSNNFFFLCFTAGLLI